MNFTPKIPILIFMLSYIVKEHKIEKGNFVIWDEAHFGTFSQAYLDRKFYFDVHPPLGKMLTALSGYIYGQSSDFLFKSTEKFPDTFDYVGMRRCHALMGSFVPFFAYLILKEFKYSTKRSVLLSLLFIFDNGMTAISRLILLDSHLLAFTAASTYTLVRYYSRRGNFDLLLLGLAIGCTVSVKWIGCLTILFVGLYIIYSLCVKLITEKLLSTIKAFMKYSLFLIVSPISLYVIFFAIHFKIVNQTSSDAGGMSMEFNMGLKGNSFDKYWKKVSFGKQITLKIGNGYLHSHKHSYPEDDDFQITFYSSRDENNIFYFQKIKSENNNGFLQTGDEIAILHAETMGYLGADKRPSYMAKGLLVYGRQDEVSDKSIWIIEGPEGDVISLFTKFYIKHKKTGLYLGLSGENYPGWGYKQGEIYLSEQKDDSAQFSVEDNRYAEEVNNSKHAEMPSNFFKNFIEMNIKMFNVNKSFIHDSDLKRHRIDSNSWEWVFLIRGLRMSQWGNDYKFYMFFNPLLFYLAQGSMIWTICRFLNAIVKSHIQSLAISKPIAFSQKNTDKIQNKKTKAFESNFFRTYISVGGWMLHYLPFFVVGRVLYFHHYFPAYFFSLLCLCNALRKIRRNYLYFILFSVILVYCIYSPLTYGFLDLKKVRSLKIIPSWDFVD